MIVFQILAGIAETSSQIIFPPRAPECPEDGEMLEVIVFADVNLFHEQ